MTADISRNSLRPPQRFTGVVRQQGRLPLDAEETESGDIAALMLRDVVSDTICEKGTPDDGFRVRGTALGPDGLLDFGLDDGTFYLGGLRCTAGPIPDAVIPGLATPQMTYSRQPDWLTFALDNAGPATPAAGASRTDLVWLQGWEQTVTATEDSELFERALGGADSAGRRRVMSRVRVLDGVTDTCPEAFAELVGREYPGGVLDPGGCEVLSQTELTIGFTDLDPLNDLCRPSAQAGFLGARNETFRVQVTTPGRFVWGRDNAAPLYRVQVIDDPDAPARRRIVFLTPPRDEFGWPLAGMTVEVLRWGALLDNKEKVAEPTGLLLTVENGYNPADDSIVVSAQVPLEWDAWFATADGTDAINPLDDAEAGLHTYHYLRVWTGGGAGAAVDHAIDISNPVALGETGLTAEFSADGMPGDYWIVSARPNTPTEVTPWNLLGGTPPAGPRRLVAPLALVTWDGADPGPPLDCRHRFRPLCRIPGCCRVTVGDGRISHGDVDTIQEAVSRLPPEGGEICLQAGDFVEHVEINDRRNVTIVGCGRETRWSGEPGRTDPLLRLTACRDTIVRGISMTGTTSDVIVAERGAGGAALRGLSLEHLSITISDAGAVAAFDVDSLTIRRCNVRLAQMSDALSQDELIGRAAAVFMSGDDLLLERCRIEAPGNLDRLFMAVGGVHVGGGSERVIIRGNVITGGNGHGITLGSVQFVADDDTDVIEGPSDFTDRLPSGSHMYRNYRAGTIGSYRMNLYVDEGGCLRQPGTPGTEEVPDDTPLFPESGGVVRDVVILRNEIHRMGYSGISAHAFGGLGFEGRGDLVAVESILIGENAITGCMRNEVEETEALLRQFVGWGGIALSVASNVDIRDNVIAGNGTNSTEPICGVFLAVAEDVRIEQNVIERNGIEPGRDTTLAPGRRGGIIIGVTLGGVSTYEDDTSDARPRRSVDRPALFVSNNIVDAPNGRALRAIALGPVMVLGNRLTGAGRSAFASNVFGSLLAVGLARSGLTDAIFNPSSELELFDYLVLEVVSDVLGGDAVNLINLCVAEDLVLDSSPERGFEAQRLTGGETMVNDNQISLQPHSPALPFTLSSVMLLSADDVSFCNNQSEIENEVAFALTNLLAVSASLRASGNRLQKRLNAGVLSAITFAMLNQTSGNQSTHCILAMGPTRGRVVGGNTDVLGLFGVRFCEFFDKGVGRLQSMTLDKRYAIREGV